MNETVKNLSDQITNFWNKYDKKQKIKVLGITVLVIAALTILVIVLNQPKMVVLTDNLSSKQAADIRDILEENNITYKVSDDSTSIKVDARQLADANMALGQKGIPTKGFTYEDAFNSGFSTTETEKFLKYKLAFKNEIAEHLKTIEGIEDAKVNLVIPESDRTIFDENKQAKASIIITTSDNFNNVQGVVNYVTGSVENLDPSNIKVIDHRGKLLYAGSEEGVQANINSQIELKQMLESQVESKVVYQLINSGLFDDADVAANLVIDFDKLSSVSEQYSTPEGQTKGIPESSYHYESSGSNTDAQGAPGTDSNGTNTEYYMPDESTSENNTVIDKIDYNVNKTTTSSEKNPGDIVYDDSRISVIVNRYKVYDEEVLKKQGLLEDVTFEEFREQNKAPVDIPIDDEVINIIKNATGIDNVSILGTEIPVFNEIISQSKDWKEYIPLALTILIIALLAFVVYKGTAPVEVLETEPELSVEDMLATTKEHQRLDDIEFDDKSETRKQIEKFVDDNPEAVAQLLRNWLNEDWE